jgi:hypothetical protein
MLVIVGLDIIIEIGVGSGVAFVCPDGQNRPNRDIDPIFFVLLLDRA